MFSKEFNLLKKYADSEMRSDDNRYIGESISTESCVHLDGTDEWKSVVGSKKVVFIRTVFFKISILESVIESVSFG